MPQTYLVPPPITASELAKRLSTRPSTARTTPVADSNDIVTRCDLLLAKIAGRLDRALRESHAVAVSESSHPTTQRLSELGELRGRILLLIAEFRSAAQR